jgi:hypothetical protein
MMPCNLKLFARSDSFIRWWSVRNCGSVQKTFCFVGNGFAPVGSLKDKFNTFILKNKLIAKSIEGILHNPKVKSRTTRDYGFSAK